MYIELTESGNDKDKVLINTRNITHVTKWSGKAQGSIVHTIPAVAASNPQNGPYVVGRIYVAENYEDVVKLLAKATAVHRIEDGKPNNMNAFK